MYTNKNLGISWQVIGSMFIPNAGRVPFLLKYPDFAKSFAHSQTKQAKKKNLLFCFKHQIQTELQSLWYFRTCCLYLK